MPEFTYPALWLTLSVVLFLIEIIALGLNTIWFAIGALLAWIGSLFKFPIFIQVIIFLVSSITLLLYTGPIARKYLRIGREKTNSHRLIGQIGLVIEGIDEIEGKGQVKVGGEIWSAKSVNGENIGCHTKVKILGISGVKLIVQTINQEGD